jgi:hypothetical protein
LVADLAAASGYGAAARDFALLEAGAMMQLLMMAAGTLGLGLCPIGGLDDDGVGAPLSLGPGREMLHSLCGGMVREAVAPLGVAGSPLQRGAQERLRAFLRQRLPRHMVPHRIVVLDTLPLTSNGKIDRAALAAPPPASASAPVSALAAPVSAPPRLAGRGVLAIRARARRPLGTRPHFRSGRRLVPDRAGLERNQAAHRPGVRSGRDVPQSDAGVARRAARRG